jgi:hypothetical protein
MIKINDIIQKTAFEYAEDISGEEGETAQTAFKDGAEFAVNTILGLQNQFPLLGIITIQGDPNDKEAHKLTVKMTGLNEAELIDDLLNLVQSRLQAHKTGMVVVTMPEAEALRRKAFEESLAVVRGGKSKPD